MHLNDPDRLRQLSEIKDNDFVLILVLFLHFKVVKLNKSCDGKIVPKISWNRLKIFP